MGLLSRLLPRRARADRPLTRGRTEQQWREALTEEEYRVLRRAGTERAGTGAYTDTTTAGVYLCRACGAEVFRSTEKFTAHCGWPSFFDPADSAAVVTSTDWKMGYPRTEVRCTACDSHLGHVFRGEGYATPSDQRYCINSLALRLEPSGG